MEVSLASKQWRLSQPKQAETRGFERSPLVRTSGSQRLTTLPTITMLVLMIFTSANNARDPSLRIESFAVISLRGVSTKLNWYYIHQSRCKHTKNFFCLFLLSNTRLRWQIESSGHGPFTCMILNLIPSQFITIDLFISSHHFLGMMRKRCLIPS